MTTINLAIEFGSLGETTEQEAKLFIDELKSEIEKEYPEADVTVLLDVRGFGGLDVLADDSEAQDEITNSVREIQNRVWENGQWHNECI